MRHAEGADAVVDEAGLGVGQDGAAGGGVPGVADGDVAGELGKLGLLEGLGHQSHADVDAGLAVGVTATMPALSCPRCCRA